MAKKILAMFRKKEEDDAESEFEKYRVIQDRLFSSDFDKLAGDGTLPELPFGNE